MMYYVSCACVRVVCTCRGRGHLDPVDHTVVGLAGGGVVPKGSENGSGRSRKGSETTVNCQGKAKVTERQ